MKNQEDKTKKFDEHLVKQVLGRCWSKQSSSTWKFQQVFSKYVIN